MSISKKTLVLQLLLLSLLFLASYSIRKNSAQQITSSAPAASDSSNSTDQYIQGICTSSDRCEKMCPKFLVKGCTCYNNGTCVNGFVNKCQDCRNSDVFAVLQGQSCPDHYPNLCPPLLQNALIKCMSLKVKSCVCKTNGICKIEDTNSCMACRQPGVLAVFQNQTCPAKRLSCVSSKTCNCN